MPEVEAAEVAWLPAVEAAEVAWLPEVAAVEAAWLPAVEAAEAAWLPAVGTLPMPHPPSQEASLSVPRPRWRPTHLQVPGS